MNKSIKLKALALLLALGGAAFADVADGTGESTASNVASNWKFEGENNNGYLVEVIAEGDTTTGWKLKFSNGTIDKDSANILGDHTELDFSMLDGSESPVKVTRVNNALFRNNTSITSVKLPSTVTEIEVYTFQYCSALTYFDFSNITTSRGAFMGTAISGKVNFPVLTSLGSKEFSGAKQITHIEMPKVTTIPNDNVFQNCTSLTSVVLPVATSIGTYAFSCCTALNHLVIPSVTYIDTGAFMTVSTSSFQSLKLPWCMKSFASNAFHLHTSHEQLLVHRESPLAKLTDDEINTSGGRQKLPITRYGGKVEKDGVEWLYDDAVWNEENKNYDIQSTNVTIVAAPGATNTFTTVNGEVVIKEVQITIPSSLTIPVVSRGENGEPVTGENGELVKSEKAVPVTAIEACAFKNNEGLTCVTVPKTVTRIGVAAFPEGCYIKIKNDTNDPQRTQALVDQLNDEYGLVEGTEDEYYASIDNGNGLMIIVK